MIAFPPFEPDRMQFAVGASTNVINCLPIADSWGPLNDISVVSEELGERCLGGVWIITSSGAYRIIVGTATKLYEYNSTTFGWDDISRLAGGAYAVPDGDEWCFAPFGAGLTAWNIADDPQDIDIDAGTNFAALAGSPPKAKYAWRAGAQLCIGNIVDHPNRVMVSGIGDRTFWTPLRRGCDFQDFPDGEQVVGGRGSQGGGLIVQKSKFRSMTMQQGDAAFRTDVLNDTRGVIAPLSIGWIGPGQFVYLSADGFFMGVEGKPIGIERVDEWFLGEVDMSRISEVKALVDPFKKIVWFRYPTTDGVSRLLGYKWPLDRWCFSDAPITQMLSLVTSGISIDGLDAYYDTIDDVVEPFDSALFTGGVPRTAVFNADDELGYLTGPPMAATLDTPDTQLTPGMRTYLDSVRLISDATAATLRVVTSDYHGGGRTVGDAVSLYTRTGKYKFASSALMHAFRAEIPAGAAWSHMTAVDFPVGGFAPEGQL